MAFLIVLAALCFLMFAAYRGYSVILFAPIAALGAVLLTEPSLVAPMFTGLFMDKMVGFLKLYFPVFMLGAVFGKLIELSGFSKSIVAATIGLVGRSRAILSIVLVCALLTYGGVSPGTPQIQNIIPTAFFGTNTWAAPWLGTIGGIFILIVGLSYLDWRRRKAAAAGEGYGSDLVNEPEPFDATRLPHPLIALLPLVLVGVCNKLFTDWIPRLYGETQSFLPSVVGSARPVVQEVSKVAAIWAVEGALLAGILCVLVFAWRAVMGRLAAGTQAAVGGALLASMNTASEYGFGAVIAALPGFKLVADALHTIPNPLVNEAVTVTALAGITGSASGGMSIALGAMAETFIHNANAAGIPMEVLHRVAAMASGGMDTLPHNGAVITLLAVTGLTHRQAYKDIFAITVIKTLAVAVVIAAYYLLGVV